MLKLNKFKICAQLRENVFFNYKLLKFKRKKWLRLKLEMVKSNYRFILKRNFKQHNFVKRYNFGNIHKNILNFKRKLKTIFGSFFNNKRFRKVKNATYSTALVKRKFYNQGQICYSKALSFNKLHSTIQYYELSLSMVLFRSNFIRSITGCYNKIIQGFVKVNNIYKKDPLFKLKVGDVVSLSGDSDLKTSFVFYRDDHLCLDFKKLKILVSRLPNSFELSYPTNLDWNLLPYILKLKR